MTRARSSQIDLASTPYYHVISRCVRRAFLCGRDKYTGQNFEHRRAWLVERIKLLTSVYAIDIAAYAIMSNHYHLVLRVDKEQALHWSVDEVIERWYRLYKSNVLVDRYRKGEEMSAAEMQAVNTVVNGWRQRLHDISWLMKNLNEYIARKANREDKCTGKYWEGRFKSQALLDEIALLSCMAYVDLNPIRAKMVDSLPASDFTSIQARIRQYSSYQRQQKQTNKGKVAQITVLEQPRQLLTLNVDPAVKALPFGLQDYLALVDWSGRHLNSKQRGVIKSSQPDILAALAIPDDFWLDAINNFEQQYGCFAGSKENLRRCANDHNAAWYKGVG
jgi:REP element-mobilizing transposase RayT